MSIEQIIALVIGAAVGVTVVIYLIANQKSKVKEWLLWAVTEAEKELGGGTGQLKLRQVYDWFVSKFKFVAAVLPFAVFSAWVDVALQTMRKMLSGNTAAANYVEGGNDNRVH